MTRSLAGLTFAAAAILVFLAACGSDPQQKYLEARGLLDAQSGQIVLPLETYAMTSSEVTEVAHANALLIDDCLAKGGREFPRAKQDWDGLPNLPDRRYGVWSFSDAQSNGYELPEAAGAAELAAQEDALGEDWWNAYQSCRSDSKLFPVMGINTSQSMSPVDQGMRESFEGLLASSNFAEILKNWSSCIESGGLTVNPDERFMVPAFPPAGEDQLRVAAVDVGCKESKNSVQPLADFEARQQMAYIAAHESELTEYRAKVDDVLAAAREVLATRGG